MTRFRGCSRCRGPWRGPTKVAMRRRWIAVRLCNACIEACREEEVPILEMLDELVDAVEEGRRASLHPPTTLQGALWETREKEGV